MIDHNRTPDDSPGNDRVLTGPCRAWLARLGLLSATPEEPPREDEMAMLRRKAWTIATGEMMLRRFM